MADNPTNSAIAKISYANQLLPSAMLVTVASLTAMAAGFLLNAVIAWVFGADASTDAYWAGISLPNLISIVVIGSLQITLIPVFVAYLAQGKETDAWKVASSVINLALVLLVLLVSVGMIAAPAIVRSTVPGFNLTQRNLATSVLRIQLPSILFSGLAGLLSSIHYAKKRFLLPSVAPLLNAATKIAIIVLTGPIFGVRGIAVAALLGSMVHCGVLAPIWLRRGRYWALIDWDNPGVRQTVQLAVPWVLGNIVGRSDPLFTRYLASSLPEGSVTYLGYGERLRDILAVVISKGLSTTLFPVLAERAATLELESLGRLVTRGTRWITYVALPLIAFVVALRIPIIKFLFERGSFTPQATIGTSIALAGYAFGAFTGSLGAVDTRTFYALKDTRTPVVVSTISLIIYVPLASILSRPFSYFGIALAHSIRSLLTHLVLLILLSRQLRSLNVPAVGSFFLRILGVSLALGLSLALTARYIGHLPEPWSIPWVGWLLASGAYALLYVTATHSVAKDEWHTLSTLIGSRIARLRTRIDV